MLKNYPYNADFERLEPLLAPYYGWRHPLAGTKYPGRDHRENWNHDSNTIMDKVSGTFSSQAPA